MQKKLTLETRELTYKRHWFDRPVEDKLSHMVAYLERRDFLQREDWSSKSYMKEWYTEFREFRCGTSAKIGSLLGITIG